MFVDEVETFNTLSINIESNEELVALYHMVNKGMPRDYPQYKSWTENQCGKFRRELFDILKTAIEHKEIEL